MRWINTRDDELYSNSTLPAVGSPLSEQACMRLSYRLALQGVGTAPPNPLVGAVLRDKNGCFVAAGAHRRFGGPHAEAALLAAVQSQGLEARLQGATLYCTLEPCAFVGKTPACARTWAGLPIRELVYAQVDPHPRVNGAGLSLLQAAGIRCRYSPAYARLCEGLTDAFTWAQRSSLPFVGLKAAISLDGMMGRDHQARLWVTGERARLYGHWLRHCYQGVVVGAATLLHDNPALTVRHPRITQPQDPCKIVLDPHARALTGRPLEQLQVLQTAPEKTLWVLGRATLAAKSAALSKAVNALEHKGAQVLALANGPAGFEVDELLATLAQQHIPSLLLEGGRGVWASFLGAHKVQKLHLFQSAHLLGAASGLAWSSLFPDFEACTLKRRQCRALGPDWLMEGLVDYGATTPEL